MAKILRKCPYCTRTTFYTWLKNEGKEHARGRDTSFHGEYTKYDHGYKVTTITGLSGLRKRPIPLYDHIHSPNELDYLLANNITNIVVQRIAIHLRKGMESSSATVDMTTTASSDRNSSTSFPS